MDTQKRIIVWFSTILVIVIAAVGAYQVANSPLQELPRKDGSLSLPVNATDWTKGAPNAKVSFVEYSDFECPACGAYHPLLEEMFAKYKNDISFTYRHFPLSQHKNALPAAYAAEAAGAQEKFWEMADMIFTNQTEWSESKDAKTIFEGYAQKLGLNMEKYEADVASDTTKANVESDTKSGTLSALDHTPTFFINGKMVGDQSPENLEALIKESISTATTSVATQ